MKLIILLAVITGLTTTATGIPTPSNSCYHTPNTYAVPGEVSLIPAEDLPFEYPLDAPDVVVIQNPGRFAALATDYQMDGTMWAAVSFKEDSATRVYRSTNHGRNWSYFGGFYFTNRTLMRKLQLVVGDGDSAKVFVLALSHDNDGDLYTIRWNMDGSGLTGFNVLVGPDSITDFAACRDYNSPYYLYAVAHNGMNTSAWPPSKILRSTTFGKTWEVVETFFNCDRPHISAGAGNHIYLSAVPNQDNWRGWIVALISDNRGASGSWTGRDRQPDTTIVWDAAMSPAFTTPTASAVLWLAYSNRVDGRWFVNALHSTETGANWQGPTLVGDSSYNAAYLDLKNYNAVGNTYMNISYWGDWDVYHQYVNAPSPAVWSTPLKINDSHDCATGINTGPALAYSPGGGPGGGVVWMSKDSTQILWNSPWMTGLAEYPAVPFITTDLRITPNPALSNLQFNWSGPPADITIYDTAGREIRSFRAAQPGLSWNRLDANGRRLPAGIYFARLMTATGATTRTMVLH